MAKATICVEVDKADEVSACDAWFEKWESQLDFCSVNQGCGCCVDIWEVDGPDEAIAEIPQSLRCYSASDFGSG